MVNLFISYSHADYKHLKEFEKHLSTLIDNKEINPWIDFQIYAGDKWDDEIKNKITQADIVLFFVSADFIASKYIKNVEIDIAIERYKQGKSKIVPIILRPCDWESSILGQFQALPSVVGKIKAVSDWDNSDSAYTSIVKSIRQTIKELKTGQVESIKTSKKEVQVTDNITKPSTSINPPEELSAAPSTSTSPPEEISTTPKIKHPSTSNKSTYFVGSGILILLAIFLIVQQAGMFKPKVNNQRIEALIQASIFSKAPQAGIDSTNMFIKKYKKNGEALDIVLNLFNKYNIHNLSVNGLDNGLEIISNFSTSAWTLKRSRLAKSVIKKFKYKLNVDEAIIVRDTIDVSCIMVIVNIDSITRMVDVPADLNMNIDENFENKANIYFTYDSIDLTNTVMRFDCDDAGLFKGVDIFAWEIVDGDTIPFDFIPEDTTAVINICKGEIEIQDSFNVCMTTRKRIKLLEDRLTKIDRHLRG